MVHLEIPALYRLDVGSSKWGWHKMFDLTSAVNNLLGRSVLNRMTATQIGKEFGYLNIENPGALWCANAGAIDLTDLSKIVWHDEGLFVPAKWSMRVLEVIKHTIKAAEEDVTAEGWRK